MLSGADAAMDEHPRDMEVTLRVVLAIGSAPRVLAHLVGGPGTLNVPSWAPEGRRFAFVGDRLG